jgi:putative DNA primase/helicase
MENNQLNSPNNSHKRQGEDNNIKPVFNFEKISIEDIKSEVEQLTKPVDAIQHTEILSKLLTQFSKVDFRELAGLENEDDKLKAKHFLVCSIEQILQTAIQNNWGLCKNLDFVYLYNSAYWSMLDKAELQMFLGEAAERLGVYKFDARVYHFREQLFKQFLSFANLPKPEQKAETVLINLKNGTFEITPEKQFLRPPQRQDFLTYQLPFEYNQQATAPVFQQYLNTVLPDIERQYILAEYLGYVFIKASTLKLEKTLLLYGTGANGKSVFFEVVNALLGANNVSSYSLQSLTNENGYYRAMIANKIVNYASEINGKLETAIFKQLVSGEPVEARLPYGEPMTIINYAKLIFNCNELPKDVEQTNAYFRRFLIIPFDKTIPEQQQDKELSKKIIDSELSGVFNWVLQGLNRLLIQKKFTNSEAVNNQLEQYKKRSDSVLMFLEDENFEKSNTDSKQLKEVYILYNAYCLECGYHKVSSKTFADRLRNAGYCLERKNYGLIVYIKKQSF